MSSSPKPPTIAITGASGKLGGATLSALLAHNLVPASSIVALTSSQPGSPTWAALAAKAPGLQVRHASFEDPASFELALQGVDRFFLVSTPHIALDFDRPVDASDAGAKAEAGEGEVTTDENGEAWRTPADGHGRERHHRVAIAAALRAGVPHIYYSSLAFGWDAGAGGPMSASAAGVMRAHLRTEAYLAGLLAAGELGRATIVREGLYAESWPLYLGYFDARNSAGERDEVALAADGKVSWTAIADLGAANAALLAAADAGRGYGVEDGRPFYLATRAAGARNMLEIAGLVGRARGREVRVKVVGRKEHERYYVEERGKEKPAVRWWVSTYEALERGECAVDDPTLERVLESLGVKPTSVEEVVERMVKGG